MMGNSEKVFLDGKYALLIPLRSKIACLEFRRDISVLYSWKYDLPATPS